MKKRVTIFALMIFTVLLSVSAISASDVNTVDSNSTVLTAVDDSVSVDTGVQSANVELSSFNDSIFKKSLFILMDSFLNKFCFSYKIFFKVNC